jgi:hypothetical protein
MQKFRTSRQLSAAAVLEILQDDVKQLEVGRAIHWKSYTAGQTARTSN